jgi:DNA-binding transcriptional regulator YiaG
MARCCLKGNDMGKLEETIRTEIRRLARKELRDSCGPAARDVRVLKRTTRELQRAVKEMQGVLGDLRSVTAAQRTALAAPEEEVKAARMSAGLIAKLRARLGLTQAQLAALLGVTGAAVSFWERGRSRPKGPNLAALVALRKRGRREVKKLLAEKAPELLRKPKARRRRKGRPVRKV